MLQQGVIVTIAIFVAGLIYHAGQLSQRLNTVERDQNRLYEDLRAIRSATDQLLGRKAAEGG